MVDDARKAHYDNIVSAAMDDVLSAHRDSPPPIVSHVFFGATDISPDHLAIWLAYADEAAMRAAARNGKSERVRQAMLALLEKHGYPAESLPKIHIGFLSYKEVEAAGGFWKYLK